MDQYGHKGTVFSIQLRFIRNRTNTQY